MSDQDMTTTWKNVEGRADALKEVTTRLGCYDLHQQVLTDAERLTYALCEELDDLKEEIAKLKGDKK